MRFALTLPILALLGILTTPALAQVDSAAKVHARLIAESAAIAPGQTLAVALEEDIRPGWHTYWLNPGDAGAPTTIQWSLPTGFKPQPIAWPYPRKLPVGPLMDYGYEGKVWLLSGITAPKSLAAGQSVVLKALTSWLVCKEVCIPEDATLTLSLRTAALSLAPDAATASAFTAARAKVPVSSPWPARYRISSTGRLSLFLQAPQLSTAQPLSADFFPVSGNEVKMSAPQTFESVSGGLLVGLEPARRFRTGQPLSGVLVLTSKDGSVEALNVNAREGLVPETRIFNEAGMTVVLSLLFAFLGGLILNLMPCVLPVLAMKAVAFARHAGQENREIRLEAASYGLGAIVSFAALGLLLLVLRQGGADIGWGFQLQEPTVVGGFALLMFAVGLNLSGVYEINPVAAGETLVQQGGAAGAFFTGVLAVAVAAPCTAPFMAAALGFALSQSGAVAFGVFLALGIGFALPFVLLGISGAFRRFLPRPGAWMVRLREALAFPMYATAAWLLWVLAQETNATGIAAAFGALLLFAFAMWVWSATRNLGARGRGLGIALTLIGLVASFSCLAAMRETVSPPENHGLLFARSEPYTDARLKSLRVAHQAVFVDATAAWCITCLVNDEGVLSRPAVHDAFADNHVTLLVADWTNRNAEITRLLAAHGRSGVPLYLYYASDTEEPVILPQILTENAVLSAIGKRT